MTSTNAPTDRPSMPGTVMHHATVLTLSPDQPIHLNTADTLLQLRHVSLIIPRLDVQ